MESGLPVMPIEATFEATIPISVPTITIPRVSFVIPTLNEAKNLPHLMPRIPEWVYEVIIVDGRSTDNTVEVAQQLRPDVRIVMEPRRGKGVALQAGFKAAVGDVIIMLDADGSMAPEESIHFLGALMAGADLVKGSRYIQGAGSYDISKIRNVGNWGLTQLVRWLYGCSFSDLCYGYIAFWTKHTDSLACDCAGFEIETLINVRAIKCKLKITEVASFEQARIHGESNLRAIPDGLRILRTIFRERLNWQINTLPTAQPIPDATPETIALTIVETIAERGISD